MGTVHQDILTMKDFFHGGKTYERTWRVKQLSTLKRALVSYEGKLSEALRLDLGKDAYESYITEIGMVNGEIDYALKHLKRWMSVKRVPGVLANFPSRNYVLSQPLGVVLIMSPWNYPVQLTLAPLVAAFSAGDCAVVKPSRYSAHTSAVLKEMLDASFPRDVVLTYEGGSEMNTMLLAERFDHIFFTGSPHVGKVVMEAASKFLTPVTLELGGKSPVIIDETADIDLVARRIAWGKCLNAGQTCVAPDYVLIARNRRDAFIGALKREIQKMYTDTPLSCAEFPRIVNEKHYERLKGLLKCGSVAFGGAFDDVTMKISPTVITDPDIDSPLMQEEIFGPILPVIVFDDFDGALDFVSTREHPLALYLFSTDAKRQKYVTRHLLYGGGCINDCVCHLANSHMPFGGVGSSGMGRYHGKDGFDTFSHKKSILVKPAHPDIPLRYAPYKGKMGIAKKLM